MQVKEIVESLQMKGEEVKAQPVAEAVAAAAPIAITTTMEASAVAEAATPGAPAPATPGVAAPATPAANFSSAAGLGAGAAQAPRPRRARAAPARPAPAAQQESRGVQVGARCHLYTALQQVYDFCIMLLVAAIAALLYRRIGIMQVRESNERHWLSNKTIKLGTD